MRGRPELWAGPPHVGPFSFASILLRHIGRLESRAWSWGILGVVCPEMGSIQAVRERQGLPTSKGKL